MMQVIENDHLQSSMQCLQVGREIRGGAGKKHGG